MITFIIVTEVLILSTCDLAIAFVNLITDDAWDGESTDPLWLSPKRTS